MTEGRLLHAESFCCPREVKLLGNGDEMSEMP